MKKYSAQKAWNKELLKQNYIAYPAEYVIRIFKGNYPKLKLSKKSFSGKKICDISCADGRNIVLLNECGFDVYGTDITKEIVKHAKENLGQFGIKPIIKVGNNTHIPFNPGFFDYLLSWNACYYMGNNLDFNLHVNEYARVLKKNGYLIMSIPKETFPYFNGCKKLKDGYCIIKNDPLKVRNGQVLRCFKNKEEITKVFSKKFKNFVFGSVEDDCFGYDYHWFLVVCQKR
jgi:SAM-dependent methyltransferase